MSWESIIDQMKEWVIAQAYATEAWVLAKAYATMAWVEAKLYLPKADFPEYGMPVHVTGDINPDATCTYFRMGDYNGKPLYRRHDNTYYLWWSGTTLWVLNAFLGSAGAPGWTRNDPNVLGAYTPRGGYTGIATVVTGFKYLLTSFVDRGDPPTFDFFLGNFTTDNAWHDLDLSGIIPAGAKAVLFAQISASTAISSWCRFRKKTNAQVWNMSEIRTQVASILITADFVCPLDSDRKIQYQIRNVNWTVLYFTVKGWWF